MKKYIKPESQELNMKFEGVIAASIPFGDTPGNQQMSVERSIWDSETWLK